MFVLAPPAYGAENPATSPVAGLHCPEAGAIPGPFVATETTARAIFSAIRESVGFGRGRKEERIIVTDRGGHWNVYSVLRVRGADGRYTDLQGGGLGMEIDKCTGAVSRVAGIR